MTDDPKPARPACGQCGKPAIVALNELPVCIDCNYKFQQSQYMEFAQNAAMLNLASREMAIITGMPHLSAEVEIPPAPVPPIHYNNQVVTVTGGNVGTINFGNVHDIQVKIKALTESGNVGLANALAELTNVILNNEECQAQEKDELLEQVAFLTAQATASPADRKSGMIKTIFTSVKQSAETVKSIGDAWSTIEPIIKNFFNLN